MPSTIATAGIAPLYRHVLDQLQLALEREARVGDATASRLGAEAQETLAEVRAEHPVDLPCEGEDLGSDPHAKVKRLISRFHRRESATWVALIERWGDEAEVLLRVAAQEHGSEVGRRLETAKGPEGVHDLLVGSFLEGMPCQLSTRVIESGPDQVHWQHSRCPFATDWERSGVSHATACAIISSWIHGLVAGTATGVEYRRPSAIAYGDEHCDHELRRVR